MSMCICMYARVPMCVMLFVRASVCGCFLDAILTEKTIQKLLTFRYLCTFMKCIFSKPKWQEMVLFWRRFSSLSILESFILKTTSFTTLTLNITSILKSFLKYLAKSLREVNYVDLKIGFLRVIESKSVASRNLNSFNATQTINIFRYIKKRI